MALSFGVSKQHSYADRYRSKVSDNVSRLGRYQINPGTSPRAKWFNMYQRILQDAPSRISLKTQIDT